MEAEFDVIYNDSTDAYFNLACEQYLIDRADPRPVFMLWRNDRAVIIGRNQNAYAEINRQFVEEHGVKVVRRLTGGGAVFHDAGNVNYTFIIPREDDKVLNFAYFSAPIIDALSRLGAAASVSGRNDITVNGKKISGNAQCVRNGRIMHHGTLLWSADLSELADSLRVDPDKISSKGIESVRARVANIKDLLSLDMSPEEFIFYLFPSVGNAPRLLTDAERSEIERISAKKYSTWEWNWGESRSFSADRKKYFPFGLVEIRFDSSRGMISDISVSGDFFGLKDVSALEDSLRGVRLERADLVRALSEVGEYVSGAEPELIADLILFPS